MGTWPYSWAFTDIGSMAAIGQALMASICCYSLDMQMTLLITNICSSEQMFVSLESCLKTFTLPTQASFTEVSVHNARLDIPTPQGQRALSACPG